jgi:hypothetical protein
MRPRDEARYYAWSTQDELEHIAKLDRAKLIHYLAVAEKRMDWDGIQKDIALTRARQLLGKMR